MREVRFDKTKKSAFTIIHIGYLIKKTTSEKYWHIISELAA